MAYKERTENAISMFLVDALSCQCRVTAAPKCAMDMMMLNMDHGCKYDGPSLQENPYICVYGMNQDLGVYESVVCLQIVVGFCYNKQIWAALVG